MIIVAGYTRTEAHKRDAAVQAFAAMVERARKFDGCLDLSISADSVDPERVNLFECWRDEESWNAWRKVAKGPATKPRELHVQVFRGAEVEQTFRRGPKRQGVTSGAKSASTGQAMLKYQSAAKARSRRSGEAKIT
jgi:quinol monooxygenase YgiN